MELSRRRVPAHWASGGRFTHWFYELVVTSDAHHHVVMVVKRGVELCSGGCPSPFNGPWAVVVALGLFDAVRVT